MRRVLQFQMILGCGNWRSWYSHREMEARRLSLKQIEQKYKEKELKKNMKKPLVMFYGFKTGKSMQSYQQ